MENQKKKKKRSAERQKWEKRKRSEVEKTEWEEENDKQCSIVFNKTCLNNNLLPKYTFFNIYKKISTGHNSISCKNMSIYNNNVSEVAR